MPTASIFAETDTPDNRSLGLNYLRAVSDALFSVSWSSFTRALARLEHARRTGARVYVCGNGGSASTASHFACDLSKTVANQGHRGVRAVSISDLIAPLTAWSNDTAYEQSFAAQLALHLDPDDVVVLITASGRSPNILAALAAAHGAGADVIAMTGFDGGGALRDADITLHVPVHDYGIVESVHLAMVHALTESLRVGAGRGGW
jgi:D-sedoheptulose 7-phosphate isomerase